MLIRSGDNLDCGVRIRAPKGQTVNVHFTQMNLEGGTNGLCGNTFGSNNQIDCSSGGDYIEVFDGRNANAPSLSGHLTGDVTDGAKQARDHTSICAVKLPIISHSTLLIQRRSYRTRHVH